MTVRLLLRTLARRGLISLAYPLLRPLVDALLTADSRNIERWRQRRALEETGRFVEECMPRVPSHRCAAELLRHAVRAAQESGGEGDGLVCEFGVYRGATLNRIARLLPRATVWGFDSFAGLPEDWRDRFPRGTYAVKGLPRTRPNVRLVKGLYHETLGPFLLEQPGKARFLHIDCDLYSSTQTVLQAFAARIVPGTVLLFDEFFNYPGWQEGEYRAFAEWLERDAVRVEYLGYCRYAEQVAVQVVG
ncbi:MAG: TylF/MycF/NovP-related O-methyltransferase [Candidatus Latescibacterota bacterium]